MWLKLALISFVIFGVGGPVFQSLNQKPVQQKQKTQDEAVASMQGYFEMALQPQHEIRLKPDGGDMKVYVSKSDFESIAFPDREEFMTGAGKAWCGKNTEGALLSLSVYDIRTGERFGQYSCFFRRASVP